jgi:hypothetical protein
MVVVVYCESVQDVLCNTAKTTQRLTTIQEDNQTAIKLTEDEMSHKRTKHIVVKYHYSKEQQDIGTISISYISLFVWFEIYAVSGTDHKLAQLLCWVFDHNSTPKSA